MRVGLQKTSLIDYPGKVACVIFLPGCNLRCPFCHNPGIVEPERFPEVEDGLIELDDAYRYLEKRKKVLQAAVISGGEPCLRENLGDMVRTIHGLGLSAKIDTNGLFPEKVEELDADFVAMDLKTSLNRYPEIPGAGNDPEKRIRRTMDALRRKGVEREFRTTLAPGFAGMIDVQSIAGELDDGEDYALQRFRPGGTLEPMFGEHEAYAESEYEAILAAARRIHARTRLR